MLGSRLAFAIGAASLVLAVGAHAQGSAVDQPAPLRLRYATFDPLVSGEPDVPTLLRGGVDTDLWLVQFNGLGSEARRESIRRLGGVVRTYMHENAHIVEMDHGAAAAVRQLPSVRWVGYYHPAYRVEDVVLADLAAGQLPQQRYNVVVFDPFAKEDLLAAVRGAGGQVDAELDESILVEVTLTAEQLVEVARRDEVQWLDRWTAPEDDVNNARAQGGANYINGFGSYRGQGITGEIYEGCHQSHPAFAGPGRNPPIAHRCGSSSGHGTNTAGIVFGNGAGNGTAVGLLPEGQMVYANYSCVGVSRSQILSELKSQYSGMFQTASWGSGRTTQYTATSADMDNIIFVHDLPITQSQSNAGTRDSRPQAWAKNVLSIGGVFHGNNASPADDRWGGGASIGPASDGRIKPDLCAYYDQTLTTSGSSGYTSGFGGTSGATPIVAGHLGLALQLFTDGVFGNAPTVPGGTRFQNRPHASTARALLINSAAQYTFSGTRHDLTRTHQGWGFPNLRRLWDARAKTFIVDEQDILTQGQTSTYSAVVTPLTPELRVTMIYADPAANPSSSVHRINDLNLKVTAPNGTTVYHGNVGLSTGNWSTAGGSPDARNTVENVYIRTPTVGNWTIEVTALAINQDGHVETAAVDADYALVVAGADTTPLCARPVVTGTGCTPTLSQPVRMTWSGCFAIGQTVQVGSAGFIPFGPGNQFLLAGTSDTMLPNGAMLPLDLAPAGAPGCFLYNNAVATTSLPMSMNGSSLTINIPNTPTLVGVEVFWQGVFLDNLANALGLVTTDSLKTSIGG